MTAREQDLVEARKLALAFVIRGIRLPEAVELFRSAMIDAALSCSGSGNREQNQCRAASMLGVHRNTLRRNR
jgi:hypothetical protein